MEDPSLAVKVMINAINKERERQRADCMMKYYIISPEGERIGFDNAVAFAKTINLSYNSVMAVVSGRRKSAQGWTQAWDAWGYPCGTVHDDYIV